MAKSSQTLRARVSQVGGRRRKKPTSPVQRAFDDVKQLVSDTGDRLFSRSGQGKAKAKQASAKKTAASRKRAGQQRQAAAKKGAVNRIQERRATPKQGGRTRAKSR
ncbi:MAG TPA: hypothetical protein VJ741_13100 [Solirubrobacteraceae bacterium]|nr:hypothetical protein [Solirubrobacteraceae bacterium]